ncbi:DUF3644 domain-containing protein [Rothia nasisuis]|uniref:DUF3644 domain-containing protein n=1 Tax=Rothia nasisuis TaxID=2109647 RepID=UPI001F31B238|nr:DUF3644 domain-containing protein [Rothia nasisuis]
MNNQDSQQKIQLNTKLLEKSMEAFTLAIELYNKPTIKYRAEGCALFLCNAWELMLKAYLINRDGNASIYYSDARDRTISLEDCLRRVFTNDKDPLRINMKRIIDFRNTSTHFVTKEYELIYGPLFQSCVMNFSSKILELHGVNTNDYLPDSYLALSVNRDIIDEEKIKAKYPPEVAFTLLKNFNDVSQFTVETDGNTKYASYMETSLRVVKSEKNADLNVAIKPASEVGLAIAKEVQRPSNKYPYTTKQAINRINELIHKRDITYYANGLPKDRFTTFDWQLFIKFYSFKTDSKFSYDRSIPREKNASFIYSEEAINLVVRALTENPKTCLDNLKRQRAN